MTKYIFAAVLSAAGLMLSAANWGTYIRYRRSGKSGSLIPVFGGIMLAWAQKLVFGNSLKWIYLLGFAADFGSFPWAAALPKAMLGVFRENKANGVGFKDMLAQFAIVSAHIVLLFAAVIILGRI